MKKTRRAPFVVTLALAAVGSACGGSTSSGEGSGGTGGTGSGGSGGIGGSINPPPVPCPAELPAEGSACPKGTWWGNSCAFLDPCGRPEPFYAECNTATGQWHLLGSTQCECPATQPSPGTACSVASTEYCSYSDGCCPTSFSCLNGTWSETGVSCNPPYIECPATSPLPGEACNECAFGQEDCNWNQACDGGPFAIHGSCQGGAWVLEETPCVWDAGAPNTGGAGGT